MSKNIQVCFGFEGKFLHRLFRFAPNGDKDDIRRLRPLYIQDYILKKIAELEGVKPIDVYVSESRAYRSRHVAKEGVARDTFYTDRTFEDRLARAKISLSNGIFKYSKNGFIDRFSVVALTADAIENIFRKNPDYYVLFVCKSEYATLARKINSLGVKVVCIHWDFEYHARPIPDAPPLKSCTQSSALLNEAKLIVDFNQLLSSQEPSDQEWVKKMLIEPAMLEMDPEELPAELEVDEDPDTSESVPESVQAPAIQIASPAAPVAPVAPVTPVVPVMEKRTEVEFGHHGVILNYDVDRRFGFIKPDVGTENIFFHKSEYLSDKYLAPVGTRVKYFLENGSKGLLAVNVYKESEPVYEEDRAD